MGFDRGSGSRSTGSLSASLEGGHPREIPEASRATRQGRDVATVFFFINILTNRVYAGYPANEYQ